MSQPRWIWVWGRRTEAAIAQGYSSPFSGWLDTDHPMLPAERDATIRAWTAPTTNMLGATSRPFDNFFYCSYLPETGGFSAWTRVL